MVDRYLSLERPGGLEHKIPGQRPFLNIEPEFDYAAAVGNLYVRVLRVVVSGLAYSYSSPSDSDSAWRSPFSPTEGSNVPSRPEG